MWVLEKIRESMESLPQELSRYIGKNEEDTLFPSKASLSRNLHNNVLTPDMIPEFCLPPRLRRQSPLLEAEEKPLFVFGQNQIPKSRQISDTHVKTKDVKTKNGETSMAWKATKKPLPFSAESYSLGGIYESPNTRRKESLFHSKRPVYLLDRNMPTAAPRLAKETNLPKKTLSGFLPVFLCKSMSETESETPSSSDSSPLSSPYCVKSSLYVSSSSGRLKGTVSCPSLIDSKTGRRKWKRGDLTASLSSPSSLEENSANLTPPALLPMDALQCQERLQREHVLPLQGHGRVRLSAEHTKFSDRSSSSLSTVRVRVVSVEGLWSDTDRQTLNCAVSLCLTPGKLQQQESATIRNCRSPVFNEDFYFTELSQKDLMEMQLRLKVVHKAAAGTLRRGKVMGVITKPLSQLLIWNKQAEK